MKCFIFALSILVSGLAQADIRALPSAASVSGIHQSSSGNQGDFAQSLSIEVPPGRHGLQPSIKIGYSSYSGNDVLGLGWSLSTDYIQKTANKFRTYFSSEFGYLTPIGNSYYVPAVKKNSALFLKQGLSRWIRWDDQGRRYVYGEQATVGEGTQTVQWFHTQTLESMCGKPEYNCNKIELEYLKTSDQEGILPAAINYNYFGEKALSRVEFKYKRGRQDPLVKYHLGQKVELNLTLSAIEIYHKDELVGSWQFVVEKPSGQIPFSRLTKILRWGRHKEKFPTRYFSYFGENSSGDSISYLPVKDIPLSLLNGDSQLIDMNGDGRVDVYTQSSQGKAKVSYNLNTPTSTEIEFSTTSELSQRPSWRLNMGHLLDLNGDGLWDQVPAGSLNKYVINSDGQSWTQELSFNGTAPKFTTYNHFLLDLDGDGLTDNLEMLGSGRAQCWINNGNLSWSKPVHSSSLLDSKIRPDIRNLKLADINGDQLVDFVLVERQGIKFWYNKGDCSWSKENKLEVPQSLLAKLNFGPTSFGLSDLNLDGRVDVYFNSHNNFSYWFNHGTLGLSEEQSLSFTEGFNRTFVADLDGDGLNDVMNCSSQSKCQMAKIFFATKPGLMKNARTDLGDTIDVNYQPSSFAQDDGQDLSIPFILQRAVKVSSRDGLNPKLTKSIHYSNPYFDYLTRRFVGHNQVSEKFSSAKWRVEGTEGTSGPPTSHETIYFDVSKTSRPLQSLALQGMVAAEYRSGGQFVKHHYQFFEDDDFWSLKSHSELNGVQKDGLVSAKIETSIFNEKTERIQLETSVSSRTDFSDPRIQSRETYKHFHLNEALPLAIADLVITRPAERIIHDGSGNLVSKEEWSYEEGNLGRLKNYSRLISKDKYLRLNYTYLSKFPLMVSDLRSGRNKVVESRTYDADRLSVASVTNGENETRSELYDNVTGKLLQTIDPNGLVSKISYDGRGRPIKESKHKNSETYLKKTTSYKDPSLGSPGREHTVMWISANGSSKRQTLSLTSSSGKKIAVVSQGPKGKTYLESADIYDNKGNLVVRLTQPAFVDCESLSTCVPLAEVLSLPHSIKSYNESNLPALVRWPKENQEERFAYQVLPFTFVNEFVDKAGYSVETHRDAFGNITRKELRTDEGLQVYDYTWVATKLLNSVKLPDGVLRKYERNGLGEISKISENNKVLLTRTYNDDGLLDLESWADGKSMKVFYDLAHRPIKKQYSATGSASSEAVSIRYGNNTVSNSIGRIARMEFPAGWDTYIYDPMGNILEQKRHISKKSQTHTIENAYNLLGEIQSTEWKGFSKIQFVHDNFGWLKSIPGTIENIEWSTPALPNIVNFSNQTKLKYDYRNEDFKLSKLSLMGQDGLPTNHIRYSRNTMGMIDAINFDGELQSFAYNSDSTHKLKSQQWPAGLNQYQYDIANNHAANKDLPTNSVGQIVKLPSGEKLSFGYNQRLSRVTQGEKNIDLNYDGNNKLLRESSPKNDIVHLGTHFKIVNELPETHVYALGRVWSKVTRDGQVFFSPDHLGSPTLQLDSSGQLVRKVKFNSFGSVKSVEGKELPPFFVGLNGQLFNSDVGMYGTSQRFFDPRVKQYISMDKMALVSPEKFLGDPMQLNLYQYAGNNPLNSSDPNGQAVCGGICIAAGYFVVAKVLAGAITYVGIQSATHLAKGINNVSGQPDPFNGKGPFAAGNQAFAPAFNAVKMQVDVALELTAADRAIDIVQVGFGLIAVNHSQGDKILNVMSVRMNENGEFVFDKYNANEVYQQAILIGQFEKYSWFGKLSGKDKALAQGSKLLTNIGEGWSTLESANSVFDSVNGYFKNENKRDSK